MRTRGFEEVDPLFKKVVGVTKLPQRATYYSAGYDFHSKEKITIGIGETYKFTTDVKAYMLDDEVLYIVPRSSTGLQLKNQIGVIDADYQFNKKTGGNIFIKYKNEEDQPVDIEVGDRIAQGIFSKFLLKDGDVFDQKEERDGGEGSTGK